MDKAVRTIDENGFLDPDKFKALTDRQVVNKIIDGEVHFFELIMRRYNQQLFRIIRSYLKNEEACREVMQRAYIKVYEHLDQFRGDAAFSTWLIRIAINEALQFINKQKKTDHSDISSLSYDEEFEQLIERRNPEKEMEREDMRRLLESAIDALPVKYRAVFMMREVEEMNTRETAECLSISNSNVKIRLHRAKDKLRKELEKRVKSRDLFEFKGERCDRVVYTVMNHIYASSTHS